MKYIIIPIVKVIVLVYFIFIVTPILLLVFLAVLLWTFDLQYTLCLRGWPWKEVKIDSLMPSKPIHWHELRNNYTLVYPTMYHAALGINYQYRKTFY
jgi:hypothetical protein